MSELLISRSTRGGERPPFRFDAPAFSCEVHCDAGLPKEAIEIRLRGQPVVLIYDVGNMSCLDAASLDFDMMALGEGAYDALVATLARLSLKSLPTVGSA